MWNVHQHVHFIGPMLSLLAGVLILVQPKLLNYVVAIYLIAVGILGLMVYGV
jgi:hypothetical protein